MKVKNNNKGYAVVEATLIFPLIIMIFTGLMLLASYLPQKAVLQYVTQHTATMLATESSDTWLTYQVDKGEMTRFNDKSKLQNVYVSLLGSLFVNEKGGNAEEIVVKKEGDAIHFATSTLNVECSVMNAVIYKEISVQATSVFESPVNLGLVGFPSTIPVTVTSTAVVQNGDEFIRNVDIAADLVLFFAEKYNVDVSGLTKKIATARDFLKI